MVYKINTQLLPEDTEGERDGPQSDQPKEVSIAMGSSRPPPRTLSRQNIFGISAQISYRGTFHRGENIVF